MNIFRAATLALCAAGLAIPAHAQAIQVSKDNRTIAITATDKVTAIADVATVHVGFLAYGPNSDAAYANGSKISNAIVQALKDSGIPAETIQSERQAVTPVQPYLVEKLTPAERAQRQFEVAQSWTVKTAADNAAKTLDAAVKAGANQSGQIDWSFKDEYAPEAAAAAKALRRARAQAEQMATSLNVKLGALLYASNEQPGPRPLVRAMAAQAMKDVEPLAINPREIETTATVHAVFAIE
ncbi:SIMPL domain-containing protein [Edaphobacter bradus]|uniref:SIMPL domain-containing protein n=1 Tax=Edaphobacter bradus TaxID=2259016 RepID=UPI0021DF9191|nr:SIMPL domain-containing protein [Edaphobacter bradus]